MWQHDFHSVMSNVPDLLSNDNSKFLYIYVCVCVNNCVTVLLLDGTS